MAIQDENRDNGATMRRGNTIPVVEEKITIEKREVDAGSFRIRKKVDEEPVSENVSLNEEQVRIDRVSINQIVTDPPPSVRYEGDTMVVSVVREEVVIQKRLILVEEIRLTKTSKEKNVTVTDTVRKERIEIDENKFKEGE